MDFKVDNLRSNRITNFTSVGLRDAIIEQVGTIYDEKRVMREGTGKRPSEFQHLLGNLNSNLKVLSNIYIVSALYKYNNNSETRYLILVDGEINDQEKEIVLTIFNSHIPIIAIIPLKENFEEGVEHSYLSKWFRNTVGNGVSFVDIDFLIYNTENDNLLLLEEKDTKIHSVGYGQLLSYEELLKDVIPQDSTLLMFLYSSDKIYEYFLCDKDKISDPQRKEYFISDYPGFLINPQYIQKYDSESELINYINNI